MSLLPCYIELLTFKKSNVKTKTKYSIKLKLKFALKRFPIGKTNPLHRRRFASQASGNLRQRRSQQQLEANNKTTQRRNKKNQHVNAFKRNR